MLIAPYGKAPASSTLTLDDVARASRPWPAAPPRRRFAAVDSLLRRATALEAKYLLKLMLGDMRIGVKQSLVEEAIAVAAGADVAIVRHAVMLEADLSARCSGLCGDTLADARMRLFHPLGFMLASPVETPEEAVERFSEKPAKPEKPAEAETAQEGRVPETLWWRGRCGRGGLGRRCRDCGGARSAHPGKPPNGDVQARGQAAIHALLEDKYDGMRAQVHCGDPAQPGRVAIYSRNREDVTESFPELEEAFRKVRPTRGREGGYIFDGEIMGWDLAADKALPFAVLGQRIGRKRVDNDMRRQVPVLFMAFDLLFAEGELLLPLPLHERRARLEEAVRELQPVTLAPSSWEAAPDSEQAGLFAASSGEASGNPLHRPVQRLRISPAKLVEDAEAIDTAYREARARANEGVMLKAAGSPYLPGRRGLFWVKLKRELATLDVVITGAEYGNGRRAPFLSDYTFAVRGPGMASC